MKKFLLSLVVLCILYFLAFYKLDYYIMKPGSAYDVSEFVNVTDGDIDDVGEFSLMTVTMGPATPLTYIMAKFKEYEEILKLEEVFYEEEDEEEYNARQLSYMSESQFNALYVAFKKTNLPYTVSYNGLKVLNVLKDGAAYGKIKTNDEIVEIDGQVIKKAEDLTKYLDEKKENDIVKVVLKRDGELKDVEVSLKPIPKDKNKKIGLGITYYEKKSIQTEPRVKIDTEKIGGPSAGLMMTLEILNQLLDEDIAKGYDIAGTGEIHEDGTVGRIGGVEKKVVAAHNSDKEIFFVPDDEIDPEILKKNPDLKSNYDSAFETAKKIGTDMKIVPVKTIDDALSYLESLPAKK